MKIYSELKNTILTQKFGKANTNTNVMPFYHELGLLGHNGWDWTAKDGDKIYYGCTDEGVVSNISTDLNAGYGIEIISLGFKHIYWHLRTDGILVRVGQKVELGQLIGLADNTGKYTTGTHLHRGLKRVDQDGNSLDKDNGYNGAVDIEPFFQPMFVLNVVQKINIIKQLLLFYNKILEMMRAKV